MKNRRKNTILTVFCLIAPGALLASGPIDLPEPCLVEPDRVECAKAEECLANPESEACNPEPVSDPIDLCLIEPEGPECQSRAEPPVQTPVDPPTNGCTVDSESEECQVVAPPVAPPTDPPVDPCAVDPDSEECNPEPPVVAPGFTPDAAAYYTLQTLFSEQVDECFEGNRFDPASTLEGAAFMDSCQNVTGQQWKFVPDVGGYYRMQTRFLEDEDKCLEGNQLDSSSTLGGAAFMDDCGNYSGQLWSIVPVGEGTFRLKTLFQGETKCLEGNRVGANSTLGGGAFMAECGDFSGQIWFASEL